VPGHYSIPHKTQSAFQPASFLSSVSRPLTSEICPLSSLFRPLTWGCLAPFNHFLASCGQGSVLKFSTLFFFFFLLLLEFFTPLLAWIVWSRHIPHTSRFRRGHRQNRRPAVYREDFAFQFTTEEIETLRSQIATSRAETEFKITKCDLLLSPLSDLRPPSSAYRPPGTCTAGSAASRARPVFGWPVFSRSSPEYVRAVGLVPEATGCEVSWFVQPTIVSIASEALSASKQDVFIPYLTPARWRWQTVPPTFESPAVASQPLRDLWPLTSDFWSLTSVPVLRPLTSRLQ